jgi:hypothetical protein
MEWKRVEEEKWEEIEIKIEVEAKRSRHEGEVKRRAMRKKQGGRFL